LEIVEAEREAEFECWETLFGVWVNEGSRWWWLMV
jgi:hypothetical protein